MKVVLTTTATTSDKTSSQRSCENCFQSKGTSSLSLSSSSVPVNRDGFTTFVLHSNLNPGPLSMIYPKPALDKSTAVVVTVFSAADFGDCFTLCLLCLLAFKVVVCLERN